MVILTLGGPKEWVLWSDISYWCCAMCDSSMYFHQADKPALEEWYTYMDKEYGIIFDFDYLLSHPDWYLDKEDSLENKGLSEKSPFLRKKYDVFVLRKIHLFIQSEVITGIIEKKTVLKDESKIKKKKRKAKRVQKRLIRN